MNNSEMSHNPEIERSPSEALLSIAKEIGYEESPEFIALNEQLSNDPEEFSGYPLWIDSEQFRIDSLEASAPGSIPKEQLALVVMEALMLLKAGRSEEAFTSVGDAIDYARGLGFNDVAEKLYQLQGRL